MYFEIAVLIITGIIVGVASGLLGVGGCFIMVPVQYWLMTSSGMDPTLAIRIAFGTSLGVVLPTAISGATGHLRQGAVDRRAGLALGGAGVVGAFLGGLLATHLPVEPLRIGFGTVMLLAAARLAFFHPCETSKCRSASTPEFLLWGFPIGVVCGLLGVGGGVLLVPAMVIALGFEIHRAVGTSTFAIIFTSIGGILAYAIGEARVPGLAGGFLGYLNLLQLVILAGTSVPAARIGVRYSHLLQGDELRYLFTIVMVYVGLEMTGVMDLI